MVSRERGMDNITRPIINFWKEIGQPRDETSDPLFSNRVGYRLRYHGLASYTLKGSRYRFTSLPERLSSSTDLLPARPAISSVIAAELKPQRVKHRVLRLQFSL